MNLEQEEGRDWVMEGAREDGLADEELIELYGRISMVVIMNEEKYGYEIIGSGIGNNAFDYQVAMPKGEPLPNELSEIFFNKIGKEFKVTCKKSESENPDRKDEDMYFFEVQFKPGEEFGIKKQ